MKKPIALFLMMIGLASLAQAATQTTYFVDPDLGLDSNAGTLAAPFQTLETARDTVRTVNSSMTGDIIVYLRGGVYSMTQALTLDAQDSGSNGFRVIYRNYPDEEPIIDGGRSISGWTALSNGIYSANANSMVFNQLYVNNQPAQRARYPEYGSPYKIIANNNFTQQIRINKSEIEQWSNLNRVEMVIASSFTSCRLRIDSFGINAADEAVVTPMDPERAAYWGWLEGPLEGTPSYYFENHFDFLDTPGEWFLDVDTDTVYYMPRVDEDMATVTVSAPKLEELLHVEDVENVTLFGLTFQQAAWIEPMTNGMVQRQGSMRVLATDGGINDWSTKQFNVLPAATYFKGIKNIRIERCLFTKMGAAAMGFDTGTSNNIVVGNVFSDIAESAIIYDMDNNRNATGEDLSSLDTFDSNYFFRIGTLYFGGTGLFAFWPDRITISHNEFSQINGLGMNVGWGATTNSTALYAPVVTQNRFHDNAVRVLDSGAIHTKSNMRGALITQNWIYNITKRSWWDIGPSGRASHGVYLDDESQNATVSSNVFLNINDTDIKVKGSGHTFIDNSSQNQSTKDESGIRSEYVDIKAFWQGGAIGRDLEPNEPYTNGPVVLDTLFDDTFNAEMVGTQPAGYVCDTSGGTVQLIDIPGNGNRSVRMTDSDASNSSGATLSKSIETQSETVSCEFRLKAGQTDNSLFFTLNDANGKKACHIGFAGNGFLRYYYQSGEYTDIAAYSVGTWYTFRIEADVEKQTFSLWIDDELVLGDSMFFAPTDDLTKLVFFNTYKTGFFDLDYVTVKGTAGAAENNAPVADAKSASVNHGDSVEITLSGSDIEGDSLTYALVSQPTNGTLSGSVPDLTYTPTNSSAQADGFTYTVSDGQTNSAPAAVSIQINTGVSGILAGYDFDDGTSNATQVVTLKDAHVAATDYTTGAGLIDLISNNGNGLAEDTDAEGNLFGTENPISFGGARDYFGFTAMINHNDLALAITDNDYMTFTVTATNGYALDCSRFTFRTRVNQLINSAERWALFSSVDGFAEANAIAIGRTGEISTYVNNGIDLSAAKFQGLTNVTFRLYIFGGSDNSSSATLFDKVILHGSASQSYSSWVAGYGLTGTNALAYADVENRGLGDGYDNLAEFALGMNPTNSDAGSRESVGTAVEGGTNFFQYVHSRRSDYTTQGLSYLLIDSTNLLDSVSFTNAQDQILVGEEVDGYEPVTNRYITDVPETFVELQIRQD